jgi:hypothetical protein
LLAFDGPEMWEHRPRFKKKHFGLMVMHLDWLEPHKESLGMSGLKEGAVVAVGEQ